MVVAVIAGHGAGSLCVIYSLQQAYRVLASFDGETEAQGGSLPKSRQLVSGRAGILI